MDPGRKYKWWILGALGLVLAGGAGIMLKGSASKPVSPVATGTPFAGGSNALLTALKEELFAVETDKLQGRLSETEYAEAEERTGDCVAAGASARRTRD